MEGDPVLVYPLHVQFYFNPLPPHGGRLNFFQGAKRNIFISIHSLRMEGDSRSGDFQIAAFVFQSTPSAWRETPVPVISRLPLLYFNPLPPHGGRHCFSVLFQRLVAFQSTPSAWRETIWSRSICFRDTFQSTPSAWRETSRILSGGNVMSHFNPLPPHGGRLQAYFSRSNSSLFQSTPSAWRETVRKMLLCRPCDFNPLPPHGGRQEKRRCRNTEVLHFNPLPPHGGRL